MTAEQIEQNAEQYAEDKDYRTCNPTWWAQVDFIAGSHSRDEEIEELKKRIEELEDEVAQLTNREDY